MAEYRRTPLNYGDLLNYNRQNQTYNNVDGWSTPTFGDRVGMNFTNSPNFTANPMMTANDVVQAAIDPMTQNNIGTMQLPTGAAINPAAATGQAQTTAQPVTTPAPVPVVPQQSSPVMDAETLRKQALGLVDQTFGYNYGDRSISDNFLDDTINNLLAEQQNNAQSYLERGKARGIYNDIGFDAGLKTIGNSADAGRSSLAEMARGVLDKYQSRANTVRDDAYGAASTVDQNRPFQIDPYVERGQSVIEDANKYAAGDLKGAFGNTNLFDFGALNNKAGQAQGALNLRDTDLATAVKERNRRDTQGRGLGNTGAF